MNEPTKQDVPVWKDWTSEQWVRAAVPDIDRSTIQHCSFAHAKAYMHGAPDVEVWKALRSEEPTKTYESRLRSEWEMREKGEPPAASIFTPKDFAVLMEMELASNASKKGAWHSWRPPVKEAIGEVCYHVGKLCMALGANDPERVDEYAADTANIAMKIVETFGVWKPAARAEASEAQPEPMREGTRVSMRPSFVSQEYREYLAEKGIEIEGFPASPPAPGKEGPSVQGGTEAVCDKDSREEVELPPHCAYQPDLPQLDVTESEQVLGRYIAQEALEYVVMDKLAQEKYAEFGEELACRERQLLGTLTAMHSALSAPTLEAARKILSEALGFNS